MKYMAGAGRMHGREKQVEEKRNKIGGSIITVLLTGVIFMLAVPLVFGAGYTYPAADDFIAENGSIYLSSIVGPVRGPLYAAWNYFMDWQGAYTTNLLLFTITPFSRFGLNGFRAVMVMISLIFLGSLYFMVHAAISFAQTAGPESDRHSIQNKKLLLYTVLLSAALGLPGTWIGKGMFYWYTAALGYLVGIDSLFLSIGYMLLANGSEKKRGYYICSMLFGFLASGVSPQVASFVCSWHLLILLTVILSDEPGRGQKRIHLWDICPFLLSFCGAVINVTAPGSLRRSRSTMGEVPYGVADAIKETLMVQKDEFKQIWHDPLFITLAVILFFFCIFLEVRVVRSRRPLTWRGVFLVCCGVLASHFLCIFPVILGYHGGGLASDRTQYAAELEIRFSLFFAILYIAQYILQKLSEKGKRNRTFYLTGTVCGLLVCMGSFLFLNDQPEELFSGFSFELIKEISEGTVQEVFGLRKEVLDALEAAEDGTDVYLKMPEMPPTRVTYSQGITTEADCQTNRDAAALFHLNSVAVEYGGE